MPGVPKYTDMQMMAQFRASLERVGFDISANAYDRSHASPGRGNMQMRFGGISWKALKQHALDGTIPSRDWQPEQQPDPPPAGESSTKTFDGDKGVIELRSRRIKTLEEALIQADVDLAVWEVEKHIINYWEIGAKLPNQITGKDELKVEPLRQIKIWLKRIVPTIQERIFSGLTERLEAIDHGKRRRSYTVVRDPHLLEIALFDAHFGKLAWSPETNEDYDLHIAERLYERAVHDLLMKARGFPIDRILFPIGEDFFHINNAEFTTEHGTQMDVDGRLAKVFETGALAVIHAIDRCIDLAPVTLLWVPGNHDRETSWYLAKYLAAWYRTVKAVTVDAGPQQRKYHHYGVNLLGFTHGDEEPHRDLPTIMASECRDVWGEVRQCEWHVGHLHKRKETRFSAGDTFGGVGVRVIPSLSGIDAWHYRKGYVQNIHIAEAYLWSHERGYTGHLATTFRKEDYRQDLPVGDKS